MSPIAHSGDMNPMKQFFSACVSHIVELNLSANHFTIESDCCSIVASMLSNLRSLALPPCGANHEDSPSSLRVAVAFLGSSTLAPTLLLHAIPASFPRCFVAAASSDSQEN